MRTPLTITWLAAFAAAVLATSAGHAGSLQVSGPAFVVDGDTVVVDGTTVRLKGVDAAERGTALGENATRRMRAMVPGALVCDLTGEKTWGREVGFCRTPAGVDINREIIRVGA